jgi:hypothetical protein
LHRAAQRLIELGGVSDVRILQGGRVVRELRAIASASMFSIHTRMPCPSRASAVAASAVPAYTLRRW